jgi:aldose 1-epimerase
MNTPHIVSITDPATGADARILVSLGFNCFSWRPVLQEGSREMLWARPDFASGKESPSGSGIPLLFPFPGRIGKSRFMFGGREYLLEPGDRFGNAIHGFVYNRPWRAVEQSVNRVSGEFQASRDDRTMLSRWPSDFRIRVSYTIEGMKLTTQIECENTGSSPLPYGLGTHAYFRLPLSDGADPELTSVTVPATSVWEAHDQLPSGQLLPAAGDLDLTSAKPLAGRSFDTYFTQLQPAKSGIVETLLADRGSGRRLVQTFTPDFTQCVVFTPAHREAICLEPYTCVPDPFRLAAKGHATGLKSLQPGERFVTTIELVTSGTDMRFKQRVREDGV